MHCTLLAFGISLCPIFTLECDWKSRNCTWRHGAQLIPCAQAALVKRRWTQFCQGADTGKATRINEAKHYQVVEDFWICLACFCPCDLELMRMGSGFGVVVPSSEHPFKFKWTLQIQRSSYEMRGIDLFIEHALRNMGSVDEAAAWYKDFMVGLKWLIARFGSPTETLVQIWAWRRMCDVGPMFFILDRFRRWLTRRISETSLSTHISEVVDTARII